MSRAKGRTASGFRPKLHSRAESLSLESLDMSRTVGRKSLDIPKFGRENLDIPKFGRESLDMGRESLCPNFGMSRLWRHMSRLSRPNFGMYILLRHTERLMSRLFRHKLSARLYNLGLNPDAARPSKSGHGCVTSTRKDSQVKV